LTIEAKAETFAPVSREPADSQAVVGGTLRGKPLGPSKVFVVQRAGKFIPQRNIFAVTVRRAITLISRRPISKRFVTGPGWAGLERPTRKAQGLERIEVEQ
jgi:hypothetical protein